MIGGSVNPGLPEPKIAACHAAHIEYGIVGHHRADTDDDGIDRGTDTVNVIEGRILVDPAAFARQRGDAPIQGLAKLSDDERLVAAGLADRPDRIGSATPVHTEA